MSTGIYFSFRISQSTAVNTNPVQHLLDLVRKDLVTACLTSRDNALLTLGNRQLAEKLSLNDMFKIIGTYHDLAEKLMAAEMINSLDGHQLNLIGKNFPDIVSRLLNTPELRKKLLAHHSRNSLVTELSSAKQYDFEAAKARVDRACKELTTILSEIDVETDDILAEMHIRSGYGVCLRNLGHEHPFVANYILSSQAHKHMSGNDLATLGKNDFAVASRILQTEDLCDKLMADGLYELGSELPAIAEKVLAISEARTKPHEWRGEGSSSWDHSRKLLSFHIGPLKQKVQLWNDLQNLFKLQPNLEVTLGKRDSPR